MASGGHVARTIAIARGSRGGWYGIAANAIINLRRSLLAGEAIAQARAHVRLPADRGGRRFSDAERRRLCARLSTPRRASGRPGRRGHVSIGAARRACHVGRAGVLLSAAPPDDGSRTLTAGPR
jgi:hypothetical protein